MNKQAMEIRKHLKLKLSPARYEHTLGVAFTCAALAMKYHYDIEKAELAGILHDCAKRYGSEAIIKKCARCEISLSEGELMAPAIIHARLGAWMAEHKYGIDDKEILSAIECHTTGKPEMGILDKLLYVADFIEPGREEFPGLLMVRELAFEDLDEAVFQAMKAILEHLEQRGSYVDSMTREAYEYYKAMRKEQTFDERFKGNGKTRRTRAGRQKGRRY